MATTKNVKRLPSGRLSYRGETEVKLVRFGDPNMSIKKAQPARRSNFRARHNCDTAKDKFTPRYWSCKAW